MKYGCFFWASTFAFIFVLVLAFPFVAILIYRHFVRPEPEWDVFSASRSPDAAFVAENSMTGDENAIDRISVRRSNGPTVYEAIFQGTAPSIFLKWVDNSHLTVLSDSKEPLPKAGSVKNNGVIEVRYSNYILLSASDASANAKSHVELAPNGEGVTATTESKSYPDSYQNLRSCTLHITAADGEEFDSVGMSITVGKYRCEPRNLEVKTCGGIQSHFSVGQPTHSRAEQLLTSATVSEIPSYNVLPDGTGYRAIRGQFIGKSATMLLDALEKSTFSIDYNFDFDERNIRYTIPTSAISKQLGDFKKCVGPDVAFF